MAEIYSTAKKTPTKLRISIRNCSYHSLHSKRSIMKYCWPFHSIQLFSNLLAEIVNFSSCTIHGSKVFGLAHKSFECLHYVAQPHMHRIWYVHSNVGVLLLLLLAKCTLKSLCFMYNERNYHLVWTIQPFLLIAFCIWFCI